MRTASACVLLLAASAGVGYGQQVAPSSEPVRAYSLLREDEDWSFLLQPSFPQEFWDRLKYIRIGPEGWFLTVGGEMRESWERVANDNWGKQAYSNSFYLQRYMLHTDWRLGPHLRVFVQVKSGWQSFRRGGSRPIDGKKLDLEASFVEAGSATGRNWIVLQAGRQELNYGSGRLVSPREGPNVRQSFDGVKIKVQAGAWRIDMFAARPDLDKPGLFDNAPDHRTSFWGAYATRSWRKNRFDSYYLGLARKLASFNRGTAPELRHSVGVRFSRPQATKTRGWDFDYEGVWQFGSFGAQSIRAWTVASDTGYSFPSAPLQPRISVKADISSGDDPRKGSLGTFNALFPIGNYFGVLADTGPGPINFVDLHPRLLTRLPAGISISTDLVVQWRESLRDGVYAVPGFLLVPAGSSGARFVGYRPGIEARWQINKHVYLQADYGVFFAGEFLKQASPGRNINYTELWAGYKF